MKRFFFALLCVVGVRFAVAGGAPSLIGNFATGQAYSGDFTTEPAKDSDGITPIWHTIITLRMSGVTSPVVYKYDSDCGPVVSASKIGVLLIVDHCGAADGDVTYNYVIPVGAELRSIGKVHIGLIGNQSSSIDVNVNENLSRDVINHLVLMAINKNPNAFGEDGDDYYGDAAFLFLRGGGFKESLGYRNLEGLLSKVKPENDPLFYRKLKSTLDSGVGGSIDASSAPILSLHGRKIISDRAHLFSAPSAAAISKAYLIKGDDVTVIGQSPDGEYCQIVYVMENRKELRRWIERKSIESCN